MPMRAIYQGREEGNNGRPTRTEVYRGTLEEAQEMISGLLPGLTTDESGVYTLTATSMRQADGPYYDVRLEYESKMVDGILQGESSRPTEQTLTSSVVAGPLSDHPDYIMLWDHYLVAREDTEGIPGSLKAAKNGYIENPDLQDRYRWCKSLDTIAGMAKITVDGKKLGWYIVAAPEVGVGSQWVRPNYVIRESTVHATQKKGSWVVAGEAGKIAVPKLGTMGIAGGNWLHFGGELVKVGRRWRASVSYRHNPQGWKEKLYGQKG